jgi:hypothetical protein
MLRRKCHGVDLGNFADSDRRLVNHTVGFFRITRDGSIQTPLGAIRKMGARTSIASDTPQFRRQLCIESIHAPDDFPAPISDQ